MKRIAFCLCTVWAVALLLTGIGAPEVSAEIGITPLEAIVCHERTVTILPAEGGHAEAAPEGAICDGETVTFTVTPDEGFHLAAVYLNGEDVTAHFRNGSYSVVVTCDLVLRAVFAEGATPQTGDPQTLLVPAVVAFVSAAVLVWLISAGRRKKK